MSRTFANTLLWDETYLYLPKSHLYQSVIRTTSAGKRTTFFTYDAKQQITHARVSETGREVTYAYDAFGNRQSETIDCPVNYQPAQGEKACGKFEYRYAPQSNRLHEVLLNGASIETITYDNAGRIFTRRTTSTGGTTTYTFDDRGLLTKVAKPDQSTVDFTYDGLGVRKSKTVRNASGTRTSYYITANLFGFNHVLMEVSPQAPTTPITTRVYAGNSPLLQELGADRQYLLANGSVGSTVGLVDSTGQISASYDYDTFGQPTGANIASLGFTGEEYDAETHLLYLRARYYDPSLGRFISADPFWGRLEEPASQNRYVYVQNNPVLYSDPSGMDVYPLLARRSAAGDYGHMSSIVGNANMGYYFFSEAGAGTEQNTTKDYAFSSTIPQHTTVIWRATMEQALSVGEASSGYAFGQSVRITKSPDQDLTMAIKGLSQSQEGLYTVNAQGWDGSMRVSAMTSGAPDTTRHYNLFFNNCAGAAHGILDAGGVDAPFDIVPARYYQNIVDSVTH